MNRLLIDANIYSHAMKGSPDVIKILQRANEIGICAICIGELLSGFRAGTKERQNREELEEFLDSPRVRIYAVNEDTAEYYAIILDQLRTKGTPIPTNDIWIAAVAMQHGLKLFSKDRYFERISGIMLGFGWSLP